jgi:hypothetical protein
MKKSGFFLVATEIFIVLLMSLAAGYALFGVSIYAVIAFAALLLLGTITIIIFPFGSIFFSTGALIALLPALMKLNSVKWWAFSEESLDFSPTLGFPAALVIGLAVISGALLLNYIHSLQRELRTAGKIEDIPTREYASSQSLAVGIAVLVCMVLVLVISFIIDAAYASLTDRFGQLPLWTISVAGLAALVILALVIFWLAGARKSAR